MYRERDSLLGVGTRVLHALKLKAAAIVYLVYHRYKIWNRQEWKELRRTYTDLYHEACDRMF